MTERSESPGWTQDDLELRLGHACSAIRASLGELNARARGQEVSSMPPEVGESSFVPAGELALLASRLESSLEERASSIVAEIEARLRGDADRIAAELSALARSAEGRLLAAEHAQEREERIRERCREAERAASERVREAERRLAEVLARIDRAGVGS